MQKHGVILDMSCDKLTFWPGHCQHLGAKVLNKLLVPPVKELASTLKVNEPMRKKQSVNTPKYIIPARKAAPKSDANAALKPLNATRARDLKAAPKVLESERAKVPKVILKAPSRSAILTRTKNSAKPLQLAMVGAAPF